MEFFVKNKILAMTSKMNLANFSLAKTFLHSYQRILVILKAWNRRFSNFLGIKLLSIKVPFRKVKGNIRKFLILNLSFRIGQYIK